MNFDAALDEIRRALPAERIVLEAGGLAAFESDGLTAFAVRPRAVVVPESEADVVAIVTACARHRVPYVARGSGTSLSGGSLPHQDGIVIALNRMNAILRIDPRERIAVVQAGAINLALSAKAAPHGLYYAPDPSSQQICTIGGNVAFNSGGAHCLKYGMTANHVLGLRVVLPDGTVESLGGESCEQVGPDAVGLFVGSEGLLGIATEVTVRLLPKPQAFHTVLAGYATLEQAGDAVTRIVGSGLLPGALEIMDRLSMDAAHAAVGAKYPAGCEAVLIVELDGAGDWVDVERRRLERLIADSGPVEVLIADDADERLKIWKGRKSAFSAVGRLSPDFIVQDGVVPRTKLAEALRGISAMSRETGIRVANVFHAGDGNLHPLIMYDGREPGALERAEELAGRIVALCVDLGGSITGEHGVGMEKRQFLSRMFSEEDIAAMKRVRHSLDPDEISNRGKVFPDAEAPSLRMYGLHPLEAAGQVSRL
ncbi:MAG TPA: FAD-binding oxidoreductase [Planctomycetaceae bacterium]|nr:FAD-binding oxidoreductase [Planctomycetaceae bacterium]HRF00148.1 FAD-linked oxidase C-terminal domain-containing protein [Pirellulaceae bacterium]